MVLSLPDSNCGILNSVRVQVKQDGTEGVMERNGSPVLQLPQFELPLFQLPVLLVPAGPGGQAGGWIAIHAIPCKLSLSGVPLEAAQ